MTLVLTGDSNDRGFPLGAMTACRPSWMPCPRLMPLA